MAQVISESTLPIAYLAVMLGVAGALAVLLASMGGYGLMAFGSPKGHTKSAFAWP